MNIYIVIDRHSHERQLNKFYLMNTLLVRILDYTQRHFSLEYHY